MKRSIVFQKSKSGQSLVEAVVAVGMVILLVTGLVSATTSTLRFGQMSKDRTQALQYAKEGLEIVRIIKEANWNDIPLVTQTHCLSKGQQTLGGEVLGECPHDIDGKFSRTLTFSDDGSHCIAAESCRKVTMTVGWEETGVDRIVTLTSYITNWRGSL
jgi:hypothetical protein